MAPRPALESAEELAGMFDVSEFGQTVTFTRPDQSTFDVAAIFDREYVEVQIDAEAAIASTGPQLLCAESDVAEVQADDYRVTVDAVQYVVHELQPEGNGVTRMLLHRVYEVTVVDVGLELVTEGLASAGPLSIATCGLVQGERHAHERARIRDYVVDQLAVYVLDATRVHRSRPTNLPDEKLPAIYVYALEDSPEELAEAPRILKHELTLAVHVVVAQAEFDDFDDALDRLCWVVQTVLGVDVELGGLAEDLVLENTRIGIEREGSRVIGHAQMTFAVTYQDELVDLVGDDLALLGVQYDLAPADGAIEAEDQLSA